MPALSPRRRFDSFARLVAAGLQGCLPREALGGMMAKHTVSVYDMINSCDTFPIALWDEKITDHINYLLLLKAIVVEEAAPINEWVQSPK